MPSSPSLKGGVKVMALFSPDRGSKRVRTSGWWSNASVFTVGAFSRKALAAIAAEDSSLYGKSVFTFSLSGCVSAARRLYEFLCE